MKAIEIPSMEEVRAACAELRAVELQEIERPKGSFTAKEYAEAHDRAFITKLEKNSLKSSLDTAVKNGYYTKPGTIQELCHDGKIRDVTLYQPAVEI